MKTQSEAKGLKPGNYVVIDNEPCKVLRVSTSKPGKHGSAKARIEAMGLIDGKRREIVKPGGAMIDIPIIEKIKAQVLSVSGDSVQLMDLQDYSTFECTVPEELRGQLTGGQEVVYWKVMGRKVLVG
ncbi:MAG: translation initiation factor IF-5A [archaeon]|nr:MAG: translation initiation factor IF-5A [archaeon]